MSSATTKKAIKEYNDNFANIPKDYMDRLAYLYRAYPYTKETLNKLIAKIDDLKNVQWDYIKYIFYMDPKSTPRAKLNTKTFTFYVKDAKNYKEIFDEFKEHSSQMDCVISTPCFLETKVYIETPSGMTLEEKMAAELELIHHVNKPDWDNVGKTYSDMVQKTLVSDDCIICKGSVEKFYSILPRIEVTLRYMKSYDCKYNKKRIENRKSFNQNPMTLRDVDYIIQEVIL